ncbi:MULTISPECIES: BREX-4 system phosphatase PglZ [unclassified Fusobacterium]|uniref:BREX-4 system phosphatase PglZ n=1 Tax=unclassified Fusobacterium TaxID=2648384 RepID=UPI001B8DA53C|nr:MULTISPECIES: BREX-4 system phosphatase PglZ [unclassified Fusobacterium]MBR8701567.1 hypothetical protein [Fusobacterium sp. DD45]MBR8711348.1 hypothetical protein [Fusobacterium sp. DD28]MBR8751897.1 hypothetical protein [Fusobacterium sp. DD26]
MNLDACLKRITWYLSKYDNSPRVVNVDNISDLRRIKDEYKMTNNIFLSVRDYSKPDQGVDIERLFFDLMNKKGNIFLSEFTTYMKLRSNDELNNFLEKVIHGNFSKKIVLLCYQCSDNLEVLKNKDIRLLDHIYEVEGDFTKSPKLVFINSLNNLQQDSVVAKGIDELPTLIENNDVDDIYVCTKKGMDYFNKSMYCIVDNTDPYKVLSNLDSLTLAVDKSFGTEDQWNYALKNVIKYGSWYNFLHSDIGIGTKLHFITSKYNSFTDMEKWLYFIVAKLYPQSNSWCLNAAVESAENSKELLREVYRTLLKESPENKDFWEKYSERKQLVYEFGENLHEINDYCQMVRSKEDKYIYYLTDNTILEKEMMFEFLNEYGSEENREEILQILKNVYPALYEYLCPYRFTDKLKPLESYFQDYKYQKVINKIFPRFKEYVQSQASKRDYNVWLSPRATSIASIEDKDKSALYFVDAMGVEYLSYIFYQCRQHKLMANVMVGRCNLPSITYFNKEFIDVFKQEGAQLINGERGIKDLDELKHQGDDGITLEKNRLPLHLIKELEAIDRIITKIALALRNGEYEKAVVVSDHGASRLAAINEDENKWEMSAKGKHSGRCCPIADIDEELDIATKENGFWALANYDRFKGGRKSDIEVHGGATLEEVVVPIIEIVSEVDNIEISLKEDNIKFNLRKKNAKIRIFSKTTVYDVTVEVDGKMYRPFTSDNHLFIVNLPDLKDERVYTVKVYSNNNLLADDLKFKAEKEGMKTRSLF